MTADAKRRSTFSLPRDLWKNPFFTSQPFTEREAYASLIASAAWEDRPDFKVGRTVVPLRRGEVCISLRYLADHWRWGRGTVSRFIERLHANGLIERRSAASSTWDTSWDEKWDTNQNVPCVYFLNEYAELHGPAKNGNAKSGTPKRRKFGTNPTTCNYSTEEPNGSSVSATRSKSKTPLSAFVRPEWIPEKTWTDFEAFRREIGHPMTDVARERIVQKLDRLRAQGHDPVACIDESIIAGYRGVFATGRDRISTPVVAVPERRHFTAKDFDWYEEERAEAEARRAAEEENHVTH